MSSLRLIVGKPRLIIPRLNGPNETQQTTTMLWNTDHYNKTVRKILVYPKVTANMSFYSVEALFATATTLVTFGITQPDFSFVFKLS